MLLFMVAISLLGSSALYGLHDYPKWPAPCSSTRYYGRKPLMKRYRYDATSTETACAESCGADSRCGMYWWSDSGGYCYRYQYSVNMWRRVGLPVEYLLESADGTTTSKECRELTINEECKNFPYYIDRKFPSSRALTHISGPSSPTPLTHSHCQTFCALHPTCRSANYFRDTSGTHCFLYPTTVSMGHTNCSPDFSLCGTHERHCNGVVYDPGTYVMSAATTTTRPHTTTSQPTTTSHHPTTTTSQHPTTTTIQPTTTSSNPTTTTSQHPTTTTIQPTTTTTSKPTNNTTSQHPTTTTSQPTTTTTSKHTTTTTSQPTTTSQHPTTTTSQPTTTTTSQPTTTTTSKPTNNTTSQRPSTPFSSGVATLLGNTGLVALATCFGTLFGVGLIFAGCYLVWKWNGTRCCKTAPPPLRLRPPLPPVPDQLYQAVDYTPDGYVEMHGAEEARKIRQQEAGYTTVSSFGYETVDSMDSYMVPRTFEDDGYIVTNALGSVM